MLWLAAWGPIFQQVGKTCYQQASGLTTGQALIKFRQICIERADTTLSGLQIADCRLDDIGWQLAPGH
jgi:hypothetical protein